MKKNAVPKRRRAAISRLRLTKKKNAARVAEAAIATLASGVALLVLRRVQAPALVLALLRVVRVALFAFVPMQARVAPALRVRVVRAAIVRVLALPLALPVRAALRAVRVDRVRLRRLIPMN
jgi:hypothetical protein